MGAVILRPLIAIVDDDASVRRSLHRVVRAGGYTVQTFASGQEFLDSLGEALPACLVLDLHLNGSGFDLQEHLATEGIVVPIVFITADDDARTLARIETSGAAGHLWKPFDDEALLEAIHRAITPAPGEGP